MTHVLVALVSVLALSRALAFVFSRLKQPAVVGEIVAGIVIGPSVLGRFAPGAARVLVPADAVAPLGVIAQIGVVLFMFLVGLELDMSLLRSRTRTSIVISNVSVIVPFGLGALLALYLHPRFSSPAVPLSVFALFVAVSMSVTAFPVLARILADRNMSRSPLGVIALACAAVDDVTAWCLLALVVSLARAHASSAFVTIGLVLAFAFVMLAVVRPLVQKKLARVEPTANVLAITLIGLLASALATEAIGVHALFGAFVFGAIIPHDSPLARAIIEKLTDFVVVLLLPAFFAFTGLRTRLGLVSGEAAWIGCALITLTATVGKLGASFVAARIAGLGTRDAASLGILMNTRGLVELVVLNVGYDLGILSDALFAMLVLMAIVTTFATTPLLQLLEWVAPNRAPHADAAADHPAA